MTLGAQRVLENSTHVVAWVRFEWARASRYFDVQERELGSEAELLALGRNQQMCRRHVHVRTVWRVAEAEGSYPVRERTARPRGAVWQVKVVQAVRGLLGVAARRSEHAPWLGIGCWPPELFDALGARRTSTPNTVEVGADLELRPFGSRGVFLATVFTGAGRRRWAPARAGAEVGVYRSARAASSSGGEP